jgi:uncharacterized membrane protein
MLNPFDLKTALLAKHAQHVVLIHFPIGLFLTGVTFDIAALWTKTSARKAALATAATLNIVTAALFVPPTVLTGVVAWQWQLEGQKLRGLLLLHLVLGCISAVLIGAVALTRRKLPRYGVPLEIFTVLVVGLTAHVGGFLSGVNIPSQLFRESADAVGNRQANHHHVHTQAQKQIVQGIGATGVKRGERQNNQVHDLLDRSAKEKAAYQRVLFQKSQPAAGYVISGSSRESNEVVQQHSQDVDADSALESPFPQ